METSPGISDMKEKKSSDNHDGTSKSDTSFDHYTDDLPSTPLHNRNNLGEAPETGTPRKFRWFDGVVVFISLLTFLVDTVTDILLGVQYVHLGHVHWAALTFGFVFVPSLVIQVFSMRWYIMDGLGRSWFCWLVHIFQGQPLERYLNVLVTGIQAQQTGDSSYAEAFYYQQNDVCMLRLFEAFLESAPQLTLQLYVMLCTQDANWLTGTSAAVSVVALGWAVAAYSNALRQAHRENYHTSWPGLILQTVWHVGVVSSRVLAAVVFAAVYKAWIFLFFGIHWIIMTVWIKLQHTDFCPSQWEETLFNGVVGVIYCFCFFNLKEGQTRWRVMAYYALAFVENSLLLGLWLGSVAFNLDWYHPLIIGAVYGSFLLGLACMVVYYRFCHPSGTIYWRVPQEKTKTPSPAPPTQPVPVLPQPALGPRLTSTAQLPRRALLKPYPSNVNIQFKELQTPSQLSPIKRTPGTVQTPGGASLWYQHYSIDTSACITSGQSPTPVQQDQFLPGNTSYLPQVLEQSEDLASPTSVTDKPKVSRKLQMDESFGESKA